MRIRAGVVSMWFRSYGAMACVNHASFLSSSMEMEVGRGVAVLGRWSLIVRVLVSNEYTDYE